VPGDWLCEYPISPSVPSILVGGVLGTPTKLKMKRRVQVMEVANKDPGKGHFYVSLVKSAVRIIGCAVAAYTGSVILLAVSLAVAELIGIVEELV
tara:strand:+ start:564 stop:848 length:285 start_codon:yes stop_codon:yes gene_type:complete